MLKISTYYLTCCLSHAHFFSALLLLSSTQSIAEVWLNDQLSLEGHQRITLIQQDDKVTWQFAPEMVLSQPMLTRSQLQLSARLRLQEEDSDLTLNGLNITTALSPYWSIITGRQSISYIQADLFERSLSSNDQQTQPINYVAKSRFNYSQGIQIKHRLAFIEQQLFIRQNKYSHSTGLETELEDASLNPHPNTQFKPEDPSIHYHLSVGVPGYIAGPLNITLESQEDLQGENRLRAMVGAAVQLPIKIAPGDWQWAFQYATELSGNKSRAWQTSLAWLGFIPKHKLGMLWSHTDAQWVYSDDFQAASNHLEFRYQWFKNQTWNLALGLSRITHNQATMDSRQTVQGQLTLNHHF